MNGQAEAGRRRRLRVSRAQSGERAGDPVRGGGGLQLFEETLGQAVARTPMRLLAYCVMPNTGIWCSGPEQDGALGRLLGWLGLTHTQRWHARRGNAELYQGRYKAFLVEATTTWSRSAATSSATRCARASGRAEAWRWGSLWWRRPGGAPTGWRRCSPEWPVAAAGGWRRSSTGRRARRRSRRSGPPCSAGGRSARGVARRDDPTVRSRLDLPPARPAQARRRRLILPAAQGGGRRLSAARRRRGGLRSRG